MPTDVERWKSGVYGNEVREHLLEFVEQGWDSIPGNERDAWFERFKRWELYHQRNGQESYFMIRTGTPDGVLTLGQTEVVAEIADEYACGPVENPVFNSGHADQTICQSTQLHWIKLEDIPEIFDKLGSVRLSIRQAYSNSWRNIIGCPVVGKDKHEHVDAFPAVVELNETFKGNDGHSNLPRKWKISAAGCRKDYGQSDIDDLALEPATKEIDGGGMKSFNIRTGGGLLRNGSRLARDTDVSATPEQAPGVSGAISALFRDNGDRDDRCNARIKFLIDEWDTEKFRNVFQEECADFELETVGEDLRSEYFYSSGYVDGGHFDHVGTHEQTGGNRYVGLDVLVSHMGVDNTEGLARVTSEYGPGEIRVTQRQDVIITDVPEKKLGALQDEDLLSHYSPDPHSFMYGSITCTGTESCLLSIMEMKNRQVHYVRWLKGNVNLPAGVEDFHIHLSGYAASYAQPQIADISPRGMKTRKDGEPVEALDIGLDGGLGEDLNFAEWVIQRVPVDEVPGAIKNLLASFEERREGDEMFREFVTRTDEEELVELIGPEETSYEDPMMHNTKYTRHSYANDNGLNTSPMPIRVDGTPITSDD